MYVTLSVDDLKSTKRLSFAVEYWKLTVTKYRPVCETVMIPFVELTFPPTCRTPVAPFTLMVWAAPFRYEIDVPDGNVNDKYDPKPEEPLGPAGP